MSRRQMMIAAGASLALLLFSYSIAKACLPGATQAQAMVEKTVAFFEAHGAEATIAAINNGGQFLDGELYVFMIRFDDGINVANAGDHSRLGKDARLIEDPDGRFYGREILQRATAEGDWVFYKRINPANGKVQPKISWVRKVEGYVIGTGMYVSQ